ncbi:MAG: M23 family metallopeptidase [Alphaproteobacteria bacterium]
MRRARLRRVRPIAPFLAALLVCSVSVHAGELRLEGAFVQGGLVEGRIEANARVWLDGRELRVRSDGLFLLGFGRDAAPEALIELRHPDGASETRVLSIAGRDYEIERIDGLVEEMVTPGADELTRIETEAALVAQARARDTDAPYFASGFAWPVLGPITGVYGSARILNGEPRRPHYGVDIAAPEGTLVRAPADGIVALVHRDMFYTGGTVILDHGYGLSSAFLHMRAIVVVEGDLLRQGEVIGELGATGRASGAHLDWRVNLFDIRLDPALLVGPMPAAGVP